MNQHRLLLWASLSFLALVGNAFAQDAKPDVDKLLKEAAALAKEQKIDEAVRVMHKVIELAPDNDLYLATASDLERTAGHYADGLKHAVRAIELNDKVPAYYVLAGIHAYGEQDVEKSREYCRLALKKSDGASKDAKALDELLCKRTYVIHWQLDPQKGRAVGGVFQVALPKTNPAQAVTYEVAGALQQRVIKGEANDILAVTPAGNKPFTLTTRITVEPYSYKALLAKQSRAAVPADVRGYLGPGESINPRSPALMRIVAELKGSDNVATVHNILAWLGKNIEYKLEKKSIVELDFKSVDEILERKHAECRGYSMLLTALCRAADIPARPIWGLYMFPPSAEHPQGNYASHNWAEFYVPGAGWIPVDPQRPESVGFLPTTHLRIFMDGKKSKTTQENLPLVNLLYMNGEKVKFEVER
jgi:tetratricopeptide (TPR) repeat protein